MIMCQMQFFKLGENSLANSDPLSVKTKAMGKGKTLRHNSKNSLAANEACDLVLQAKPKRVWMSSNEITYRRLPLICSSMVSKATKCPGYFASKSFGFLKTGLRFKGLILPKWETFCGNIRRPPKSLMILPMVDGCGHSS